MSPVWAMPVTVSSVPSKPMDLFWEIFGYCGTVLVLVSMMMSSVVKLRVINIIGAVICIIYSTIGGAWPVVVLNMGLTVINVVQLIRLGNTKVTYTHEKLGHEEVGLAHFFQHYHKDIIQHFPEFSFQLDPDAVVYMVYVGADPAGVFVGKKQDKQMITQLDYATPTYRDSSVGAYIYGQLKGMGYTSISTVPGEKSHEQYLKLMGFVKEGDRYIKQL